jgi:hypothetical protein
MIEKSSLNPDRKDGQNGGCEKIAKKICQWVCIPKERDLLFHCAGTIGSIGLARIEAAILVVLEKAGRRKAAASVEALNRPRGDG